MRLMPPWGWLMCILAWGAGILCFEGSVLAAENDIHVSSSSQVTLHDTVQQAVERYPRTRLLGARSAQVDALRRQTESAVAGAPALLLRHQTDRIGSSDGLREWEGGIQLPLWLPGQRQARRAFTERAGEGLSSFESALRLEVAGQVRERLWDVVLMENETLVTEGQWRAAQALEEDVRKRVTAGELAKVDLLLAQDETLRRQALYLRARTELKHTLHRYDVLTGSEMLPVARNETLSNRDSIGDDHPLLADSRARVAQALAETELVRQERRANPQISLSTRQEQSTRRSDANDSVGISLTLPLLSTAHAGPRMAAASVALAEAQSARDALRRELELALDESEHSVQLARQQHELAIGQNRLAQENMRLMKKAFALGEIDLVDLMRVQTLSFTAEYNEQQLGLQLQRAIARYNQAAGEIP